MGNFATPVAVRLFAFSVLPVLLAALHVRLDTSAKDRLWKVEVYLIYLFMLGVSCHGGRHRGAVGEHFKGLLRPMIRIRRVEPRRSS